MDVIIKREQVNKEIIDARGKIPLWLCAQKVGVHESTLIRWLRQELSAEQKEKLLNAINEIKREQIASWGL